ncbi:MAG: hypothetical protein CBD00_00125, partial [Rhodospirillaceae bacterium TMED140]
MTPAAVAAIDAVYLQKARDVATDDTLASFSSKPAVKPRVVDEGAGMCDVQNSIGRRCCRTVGGTLQGDKDLVCAHHLAERVNNKVYEETKEHGVELARVKRVAQPELDTLTGALAYTEEQANNLIQYDQKPS